MSEIKRMILFGAAEEIGLRILRTALEEELEVSAFVKDEKKIPEDLRGKVQIHKGDVLKSKEVEAAIDKHDVVLSALRPGQGDSATFVTDGCKNIIAAMKKHKLTKLVVVSDAKALPGRKPSFMWRGEAALKDHEMQIKLLKEDSGQLEWVAMMAPYTYPSSDINPDYKVEKNNVPGADYVTSAEIADFMVKVFMDKTSRECFRYNMLGISSCPKTTKVKRNLKISLIAGLAVVGVCLFSLYAYSHYEGNFPSTNMFSNLGYKQITLDGIREYVKTVVYDR